MTQKRSFNFGEQEIEYNPKLKKNVEVWKSPKFIEAKKKAIETLESDLLKDVLSESDFWILKNTTSSGKVCYAGLIISHNGCLKINDALPAGKRFKPSCVTLDKEARGGALVYTYINDEQGLYEVGEVNNSNCSNAYPYAMALKRLIDRVVLKNSRLAYSGIYSDSEADEMKDPQEEKTEKEEKKTAKETTINEEAPESAQATQYESPLVIIPEGMNARQALVEYCKLKEIDVLNVARCHKLNNNSKDSEFIKALAELQEIHGAIY